MPTDAALAFLERLLETASPSGFEEANAAHFRHYVADFADTVATDRLGNVVAALRPDGSPRVLLAGHIDEIGLLIHYIDDDGFCYFRPIGGHDSACLVGQRVTIHTHRGPLSGVIGRKPIHLLAGDERGKKLEFEDLWIDIGASGGRQGTLSAGVRLGDPATCTVGFARLQGDRIAARALDNRVGAWVVAEALRRAAALYPRAALFAVATVQEELGTRGAGPAAFGLEPDIALAVDVTFATDFPSMDKRKVSDLRLGAGPAILRGGNANRKLADRLVAVAEEHGIPYQIEVEPGATGTDAAPIQVNRAGVVTGLVSIPLRYMHTPCEMISLDDAENAAELLARTCASLLPEESWTPS